MNDKTKLQLLQNIYAGVLAESTLYYDKADILKKVEEEKKKMQFAMAERQNTLLNNKEAKDIFNNLSEIFGCAKWEVNKEDNKIIAIANSCKLCSISKSIGSGCPCNLYCLNPIKAMAKGLNNNIEFDVKETKWQGDKCYIEINNL
ncbi:MAG: hypothetical protein ACOCRK_06780 [bacterium]